MIKIDENIAKVLRELMTQCSVELDEICAHIGVEAEAVWRAIDGTENE